MWFPLVISEWSVDVRRNLAAANLLIPSFYAPSNWTPLWGWGVYSFYLKVLTTLGVHAGTLFF